MGSLSIGLGFTVVAALKLRGLGDGMSIYWIALIGNEAVYLLIIKKITRMQQSKNDHTCNLNTCLRRKHPKKLGFHNVSHIQL